MRDTLIDLTNVLDLEIMRTIAVSQSDRKLTKQRAKQEAEIVPIVWNLSDGRFHRSLSYRCPGPGAVDLSVYHSRSRSEKLSATVLSWQFLRRRELRQLAIPVTLLADDAAIASRDLDADFSYRIRG